MHNSEALCVYNRRSGKQKVGHQLFHTFGVPAVDFSEFMLRPTEFITRDTRQVIAGGGDGTAFAVMQAMTRLGTGAADAEIARELLILGTGTANVLARKQGTLFDPHHTPQVVEDFLRGKLASEPISPVQYSVPQQEVTGTAFWGVGVGAIAPILLRYLEQFRSIKDPSWRKFFALLGLLLSDTKGQPFGVIDTRAVTGWDVAFISHTVPYWPSFVPVREVCGSEHGDHAQEDYLLRFGKDGQTRGQTYAGLLTDVLALRLLGRPVTGTLHAEPVMSPKLELVAREPNLTVDSELVPLRRGGKVVIDRTTQQQVQLRLAKR